MPRGKWSGGEGTDRIAKLFAAQGAMVAVVSRTAENVDQVVIHIQAAGGIALGIVCDIADSDQITATVDKVNVMPVADTWGTAADVPAATNVLGRYGSPEEDIAPVVLYLASKDGQFLTGYSLSPDGGQIIESAR